MNTSQTKNAQIHSIINKFNSIAEQLKLSNMSAKDVSDVEQKLRDVQLEVDVFSQFTPSDDPYFENIKKINESIKNIFNQLNPFKEYI